MLTIKTILNGCLESLFNILPDSHQLSHLRLIWWRRQGYEFGENCVVFSRVKITGKVIISKECAISTGSFLAGSSAGIYLGDNVIIGPNVVLVAFNHGHNALTVPMSKQQKMSLPIFVEDDVWIGANCTVLSGSHIGTGAIIGAGSVVRGSLPSFCIAGGVPAKNSGEESVRRYRIAKY